METVHWGGGAGDKNDGKVPAQYNSSEQKTVKTTENEARLWQTAIRDGLDKQSNQQSQNNLNYPSIKSTAKAVNINLKQFMEGLIKTEMNKRAQSLNGFYDGDDSYRDLGDDSMLQELDQLIEFPEEKQEDGGQGLDEDDQEEEEVDVSINQGRKNSDNLMTRNSVRKTGMDRITLQPFEAITEHSENDEEDALSSRGMTMKNDQKGEQDFALFKDIEDPEESDGNQKQVEDMQ